MGEQRSSFGSVFQRKGREGWWVRVRRNGKQTTLFGGKLKSEARATLEALRRKLHAQEVLGERPVEKAKFETLAHAYLAVSARQHTPGTHEMYRRYIEGWLVPAFRGKIVSKLQTTDFERFLSGLTKVRTNATRNRIRGICSSVMSHAVRTGYARENPILGVRKLREEQRAVPVLDHAEQQELVEAAPDALRPLIQLALGSGLRLAELLGLEWHDVDLAAGSLTVRVAKSKRPRVIFLTAETCAVLRDLRDARAIPLDGPDRVFWWLPADNRSFQDTHRHAWCRAMKQLGRPGFRIHDCRHVYAVSLVRAGVPLSDVSKLLGHSSIQMTMRYASHAPADYGVRARALLESAGARATARATKRTADGSAG